MMLGKKKKTDNEEVKAFLGSGTEFEGKLIFTGSVRVDGLFRGEVFGGGTLISGEGSLLEGHIVVDSIIVSGEIRGQVEVRDKAEISSKGKIYGEIKAAKLVVHDGAVFEGNCSMQRSGQEEASRDEEEE
ncbi:MAG: polymer-forming cytoskeletal protein [Syntrophales bacterium]|nr:polymer-forming cytoskeletal protein [Syntrophales bacterium]